MSKSTRASPNTLKTAAVLGISYCQTYVGIKMVLILFLKVAINMNLETHGQVMYFTICGKNNEKIYLEINHF